MFLSCPIITLSHSCCDSSAYDAVLQEVDTTVSLAFLQSVLVLLWKVRWRIFKFFLKRHSMEHWHSRTSNIGCFGLKTFISWWRLSSWNALYCLFCCQCSLKWLFFFEYHDIAMSLYNFPLNMWSIALRWVLRKMNFHCASISSWHNLCCIIYDCACILPRSSFPLPHSHLLFLIQIQQL